MRTELAGERSHRLILGAGGDAQACVALGASFAD